MNPKSKRSFSKQKVAILSLITILIIGCIFYERKSEPIESAVGKYTTKGNEIIKDYEKKQDKANIFKNKLTGVRVGTGLNELVEKCDVSDVSVGDRKIILQCPNNEALVIGVDNEAFQRANGWHYNEVAPPPPPKKEPVKVEDDGPMIEWKKAPPATTSGKAQIHLAELNGGDDRGLWIEVHIAKNDVIPNLDASWLKEPVTYTVPLDDVPWKGRGHRRPRDAGDILDDVKDELDFTQAPPATIVAYQEKGGKEKGGKHATFVKDTAVRKNKKTGAYVDFVFPQTKKRRV